MTDRRMMEEWCNLFLEKLKCAFNERLVFVGLHGSWARGEARPGSDIDIIVVTDRIAPDDLDSFHDIIHEMPDAERLASGALLSISEMKAWPRFEFIQLYYGCRALYGTLEGVIEKPATSDLIEDIRIKACENIHNARHYLLYPHDLSEVVHKLYYPFKYCYYAYQSWILLRDGIFVPTKREIVERLPATKDREVIIVVRDWHESKEDRRERPLYYIRLLEWWSRKMLERIRVYESGGRDKTG